MVAKKTVTKKNSIKKLYIVVTGVRTIEELLGDDGSLYGPFQTLAEAKEMVDDDDAFICECSNWITNNVIRVEPWRKVDV